MYYGPTENMDPRIRALYNLVRGECTMALQLPRIQESGLRNLVRGEYATAPQGRRRRRRGVREEEDGKEQLKYTELTQGVRKKQC